jgi:tellurite resistance protein TerC
MNMAEHSLWAWGGFCAFILLMLSIDLGLFNRKAHRVRYREAAIWSAVWVSLAMIFAGIVFWHLGKQKGLEFATGYLIELSLSVDNLFVFLLLFSYFKVPSRYQHRVLFWGVMGALVMRVTMIFIGAALIERFGWIIFIFGAFLVYTGFKMFRQEETEIHPEQNPLVRLVTRYVPITHQYEDEKFFTRVDGRLSGTLLLLVLIIVEVTDLVFAVDSIPAIFAVTTDRFILYTSNVFAILGLRSLFFLLAGVVEKFHYLKTGLAIVLSFIGVKMLLPLIGQALIAVLKVAGALVLIPYAERIDHIPIGISLVVVAVVLLGSVAASLIWPQHAERDIDVDLPEDFGRPFEDVEETDKETDKEMSGTGERR